MELRAEWFVCLHEPGLPLHPLVNAGLPLHSLVNAGLPLHSLVNVSVPAATALNSGQSRIEYMHGQPPIHETKRLDTTRQFT